MKNVTLNIYIYYQVFRFCRDTVSKRFSLEKIINKKTKQNPIQVLVDAITNTGPREETVRLKYGGINVPKSVDTAPLRRVNSALMFISGGVYAASHKNKKDVADCLADELIAAAKGDSKCYSVTKREERERIAKASR